MERVADYIIKRLSEQGIGHIFLITGRGVLYLTDAVAKNEHITGIPTYHEQGASYAAMAYAAARGGMGACLVSAGCAATNAVTGALCAYQDNLPLIFISGQHMLSETSRYTNIPVRTYGSQEADIISIVEPVTKYAIMLTNATDVRKEFDKALYVANEGRKGPVWIDVPLDIQNTRIETDKLEGFIKPEDIIDISQQDIEYIVECFKNAKRPLIFIGGGVRSSGAQYILAKLIEKYNIPTVFSASAADAYGASNPLSIGSVGALGGTRAGNMAVQNADFILCLGSKLCSQTTGIPEQFAREAVIVVIDIDPIEHKKNGVKINKLINVDIKQFLTAFAGIDIKKTDAEWVSKCIRWKDVFAVDKEAFLKEYEQCDLTDLYYFAAMLEKCLPNDATIITDAGFEELIIPSAVKYKRNQRCLFPAAQGAMGYALPAVLGAYYADKRNIVAIVGDGSFMMNMQELLAIKSSGVKAKIFVINNNMYSVIKKRQKDLFRKRTIGTDIFDGLSAPNFKKIAESFDIPYFILDNRETLKNDLGKIIAFDGLCVCEVICAQDQKYLHTSYVINDKRRLVKRPLEDLSPYIDRELFNKEMIIEPIGE